MPRRAINPEAARRNRALKDVVTLEPLDDRELLPMAESALAEYRKKGGRLWKKVEQEIDADNGLS